LVSIAKIARAQQFFNLTSDEVRIDSVLPYFSHQFALPDNYQDSTYNVSIEYPEFINVAERDIASLISHEEISFRELPEIEQYITLDRKKAVLDIAFYPFVLRNGKYQKLVSFMLRLNSTPKASTAKAKKTAQLRTSSLAEGRYAANSVLDSGTWAKISVPESGVYQLTSDVVRKAGFSDLSKVKIYGYGGARQKEILTESYLIDTDDLKEVPTCEINGKRLFFAQGPVSWSSATTTSRTRNPYADYGCYFITESDSDPAKVDSATFVSSFYPSGDYYHTLYEVDDFAWYQGGCNLYDSYAFTAGSSKTYSLDTPGLTKNGKLTICLTADAISKVEVQLNDSTLSTISFTKTPDSHTAALELTKSFNVSNLQASNTVKLTETSGGNVHLDYISLYFDTPRREPQLSTQTFPAPTYVYNITNQNHHADEPVDMVIIIPTSQKLLKQAERLKTLHEEKDGMSVRIVPADELFNEFSSGTPDANAYRRYMKLLYDKAETQEEMPKYLILFGDGVWDNRMNTSSLKGESPDDYLLVYESENSLSHVNCYLDDGYFCYLDDGEGVNASSSKKTDKPDVAVGRFPVTTEAQAKIIVDKTIAYRNNDYAGSWQNTICVMGDDGIEDDRSQNLHMVAAERVAEIAEAMHPELVVKRVMWDAYNLTSTSTGNRYPEIETLLKAQMKNGALIMNYTGHGAANSMSHEYVLTIEDFETSSSMRLPLWVTASCDIMPFDGTVETIGETAMLNATGGAVAFYGTTRTVYASNNETMNKAYTKYVLGESDGQRISIGEAMRLAKNELVTLGTDASANKLQFSLLGDPALCLAYPTIDAVIDSINGIPASSTITQMKAGSTVRLSGHIERNSTEVSDFNGILTALVRDAEQLITCKNNAQLDDTLFTYYDRPNTIYSGSDSVKNGRFSITFAVPRDISYSDGAGAINLYALNEDNSESAGGYTESVSFNGTASNNTDSIGPSIYCYLNSPSFVNGGKTNSTPYFVAEIFDKDGINAAGSGIGHDLQLVIDDDVNQTYNLNDYFAYDFGTYQSGTVGYSIPELSQGTHKLKFRAWDILNNSSTAELDFEVVDNLTPDIFSVSCTKNPASTSTTFIINHNRAGSDIDIELSIFDMGGRQLYRMETSDTPATNTSTIEWNLTTASGAKLQTGVYLYRVRISCNGSKMASKANKLIVINNN